MKKLNSLETSQERIRLQTVEQANELIERYYKTLNQQNNIKILIK